MRRLVVTGITFGVFMAEAVIHYNMGQMRANGDEGFKLRLPPPKELAKIAAVTGAFSLVSGVTIDLLQQRLRGGR